MATIKFAVPGVERPAAAPTLPGVPQVRSIDVSLARDGTARELLVEADSERHVVALSFGAGPTLYVNPRDVASLVSAASSASRNASAVPEGVVHVGTSLPGMPSRGIARQLLTGFGLFDFSAPGVAAQLATPLVAKLIEDQVQPGVWRIRRDFLPEKATLTEPMALQAAPKEPLLIFIHGTASSTAGGYQGLWLAENRNLREELFERYDDRVYALDHKTLTESPIDNALAMAEALPAEARLHLVTHSRGGMIADLLSRSQTWKEDADGKLSPSAAPFDPADIAFFAADPQYAGMGDKLRRLGDLLAERKIVVERIVRVASPSRGTVLASKRLDLYLSTLSWLIGRGAEAAVSAPLLPVAGVLGAAQALAQLAAAIAHNRTDARQLPGLEAMMPERKLVAMLNRRDLRVGGDLRVIAGDIEPGDGFFSWLKVKLVDAFYWEDHDLVVNTSSMDKGPRRLAGKAYRLLAKSAEVDHFSYFKTPDTASAMGSALQEPVPAKFVPVEPAPASTPPSAGARGVTGRPAVERPAVVVLHGIMGSYLRSGDKRIWFDLPRILSGSFTKLALAQEGVTVDGLLGRYYDRLMNALANSHEVIAFAYDWRLPIEVSAQALGKVIAKALDERASSGQPVRVVAHSMGGLVLRAMEWVDRPTWNRMMAATGARILMLGVPNQGSMAPATVLTGRDAFVNMLEGVERKDGPREFLAVAAGFPGLLQMLACPDDPSQDWYSAANWQALLDFDRRQAAGVVSGDDGSLPVMRADWVPPAQGVLNGARAFQAKLAAQDLSRHHERICIVHGHARETPVRAEKVDDRFEFQSVAEGDGRVTWQAGRIPGLSCGEWYVNAAHGDLANAEDAFNGYVELLLDGKTVSLPSTPLVRGPARSPEQLDAPPPQDRTRYGFAIPRYPAGDDELLDAAVGAWPRVSEVLRYLPDIEVEVLHANLRYVDDAIMVGHQEGTGLYSAERFLDGVYKKRLSQANGLGVYPGPLGTSQVFLPPRDPSGGSVKVRPEKALIVGLGHVGELTPNSLRETVTAALLNFAQHEAEAYAPQAGPIELRIASLLIGTGASNFTTVDSVQAILGAVQDANMRLERAHLRPSVRFARVMLVEYYENLATEALRAARQLSADGGRYEPLRDSIRPTLRVLPQLRSTGPAYRYARPKSSASGWPQFINISRTAAGEIIFGLTTDRARSTVLTQPTQLDLVERLVSEGESSTRQNDTIGQLLFELTVPNELKETVGEKRSFVLDVDAGAAALPWEMLTRVVDGATQYLALQSPMVRKLRLEAFRPQPRDARGERALVIGAPSCPTLPRLPAAVQEAQCVSQALRRTLAERNVELLVERPMLDILAAVINGEWRIMHFAGHGEYRPRQGRAEVGAAGTAGVAGANTPFVRTGMVLSEGIVLSPIEIGQMNNVPELVFINCCYLGKVEPDAPVLPPDPRILTQDRGRFAANVAEQLIRNGVRCVIAAAWAVDDNAARDFAQAFYDSLLAGETFGKAVWHARSTAYQRNVGSNTWAAYQCYGDLEWRYVRDRAAAAATVSYPLPGDTDDIVSASELIEELEGLWVKADGLEPSAEAYPGLVARVEALSALHGPAWGEGGAVAEAFGRACSALGKRTQAIEWYGKAVKAWDAQAPFEALEQWLNLRARQARDSQAPVAGIETAIEELKLLLTIAPTYERHSLLGSAYKRLTRVVNGPARRRALADMRKAYQASHDSTPETRRHKRFYATMNLLAAAVADQLASARLEADATLASSFGLAKEDLALANEKEPDFWSHAGEIELSLYESLQGGRLPQDREMLEQRFRTLSERSGNRNDWSSVEDQLAWLLEAIPSNRARTAPSETRQALESLRQVVGKLRR